MYYIIGDIHGYLDHLTSLVNQIRDRIAPDDTLIFLGDYIDRGPWSCETVDYLISLSRIYKTVFLRGNHEDMLARYLAGADPGGNYLFNGGGATIRSYERNHGSFSIPGPHADFFNNCVLYYEGSDFIAVHAGVNPTIEMMENQKPRDILWIREEFYEADKRWGKTIIFGHTPTQYLSVSGVYFDHRRNIIAVDSGVIMGGPISCISWPDREVFESTTGML